MAQEEMVTVTLPEAEKMLGVGQEYDYKHALQCYQTLFWVKEENQEMDEIPLITEAKNVVLRYLVGQQIRNDGKFSFPDIPFDHSCPNCHGTGELYKLGRKAIEEPCKKCEPDASGNPTGKRKVKCRNCDNGRFIKGSHDSGLRINVKCRTCDGTSEVLVKCRTCRGKKVFKKMVLSGDLESTTKCRQCRGKGFQTEDEQKKFAPSNPILSADLAKAIKSGEIPDEVNMELPQSKKGKEDDYKGDDSKFFD